MGVKSATNWAGLFVTKDDTGALSAATVGPAGTLYVDGAANGASVTITGANPYKWVVTLPTLTAGQVVSMYITATVDSVATAAVVAEEVADTAFVSDVKTDTAAILADTGTDGVALADDAITSAKFDESTAYPIKSADAGATQIARVGADSDTLETLSDQIDAVKAKTDLISGGAVTVVSPVAATGAATVYRGADYHVTHSLSLEWTSTDWPDLTGAAIKVYIAGLTAGFTGSVVTPTGTTKKVRLELTDDQSATIPGKPRQLQVVATLSDGDIVVLVDDLMNAKAMLV